MDRRYGGPRRSHPRPYFRPAPYGGRSRFGPGQAREEEPRWQEDRRREDWRRDDNRRRDEERRLADRRMSEERHRAEDDRLREEERRRAERRWQEDRMREDWRRDDNRRHDEERRLPDRRRSEEPRRAEDDRLREEERHRSERIREHERIQRLARERALEDARRRQEQERDGRGRWGHRRELQGDAKSDCYWFIFSSFWVAGLQRSRIRIQNTSNALTSYQQNRVAPRTSASTAPNLVSLPLVAGVWQAGSSSVPIVGRVLPAQGGGGRAALAAGSSAPAPVIGVPVNINEGREIAGLQNTTTRNHTGTVGRLVNYYVPVSANSPSCADNEKGKGPLVEEETSSSAAALSFGSSWVGQCSAGGLFQSRGGPVIHENNNICERNVDGERRTVLNHDQPVLEQVHEEVAQALAPQMIGHVLNPDGPNGDGQAYQDLIKYLLKRNGTRDQKIVGYKHLLDEDDDDDLIDDGDDDQMEDAEEAEVAADYSFSDESGGMVESGDEPGYITGVVMALAVPQGVEEVQSVMQSGSSQPEAMYTQENQDPDVGDNGGQARSGPRV